MPRRPAVPLSDREACVEVLTSAAARASAGRFTVVEVRGDAGTGKSQVLAEAGRLAREAGLEVHTGQATRCERTVPLALFTDAAWLLGEATTGPLGQWAERVHRWSSVRRSL